MIYMEHSLLNKEKQFQFMVQFQMLLKKEKLLLQMN